MTEEHETAAIFLLSTMAAAAIALAVTVALTGGISVVLFEVYVAPLLIAALALAIYWLALYYIHNKSKSAAMRPVTPE